MRAVPRLRHLVESDRTRLQDRGKGGNAYGKIPQSNQNIRFANLSIREVPKMARTDLMKTLRRAYHLSRKSANSGIPTDELIDMFNSRVSRRRLLHGGLAAASALAAANFRREHAVAQEGMSKVLIVGAGIAGLTAGYRLKQAGVPVDIIEARNRVGGRMRSLRNAAGTSTTVELGAEFIDTNHIFMRRLARELDLNIIDRIEAQSGLTPDTYYFEGRRVPLSQIVEEFAPLAEQIEADVKQISNGISYRESTPFDRRLDNLSITAYLDQFDISRTIRELIRIAYVVEYGREAEVQSSLNLLFFIGTEPGTFEILGTSDERFQIVGGNDQVPRLLARKLQDDVETGTALEAIRTLSDGRYRVSLRDGTRTEERTYERILLTLPFTVLREIPMRLDLPPVKRLAINTLGYGTNSKLLTAYQERVWRTRYNSTASVYTDLGFQITWEPTPFAPGPRGLVTNFTGGDVGLSIGSGTPESQAMRFLPQFEQIFPGVTQERTGPAIRAYWTGERFSRGSYSCYLVGQWTQMYTSEAERAGNLFFAGEHTSREYQGWMEGATRSGERAALQIMRDLGMRVRENSDLKSGRITNRLISRQKISN